MDNNSLTEQSSSEVNNSNTELSSLVDHSQTGFVPKIRIRLRPQLVQSSNLNSQLNCNLAVSNKICDHITLVHSSNEISNEGSDKCSKNIEENPEENIVKQNENLNHVMIHGINLRSRPQKLVNKNYKSKINNDEKMQFNLLISKNEKCLTSNIKQIGKKGLYKSLVRKSTTDTEKTNKNDGNNKLSRKQIIKNRNETIMSNINLKEIINQENFIKFPQEIQWQLVNFLPNCDKPKISSETNSCKCTDYHSADNCNMPPNLGFSVLNNEFLGKALTKFSLKMGQSDWINILNSERENLRSRPLTILNDDVLVKSNLENYEIKSQGIALFDGEGKILDEVKSNSSVSTTETAEMNNCGGNGEEKCCTEFQQNDCCENTQIILKNEEEGQENSDIKNELGENENKLELSIQTDNFLENNHINLISSILDTTIMGGENNCLSSILPSTHSAEVESQDQNISKPEILDENIRKRGRKRKLFSTNDIQNVPIKRSNRSTAGKRPARLDSDSPPSNFNILSINDKKLKISCKKFKEQILSNKKNNLKYENCSNEMNNILKLDLKSSKKKEVSSQELKKCPSSPNSLFSSHIENDLSPSCKSSPYGNNLFSNFTRANVVSGHINPVQTLSPSWSCTSESTTPSAKSDYGHNQTIKQNSIMPINIPEIQDSKMLMESEVRQIQRMPPPRQTLTLAAMREKMRAKKLAKEDSRKVFNSNIRKSSTFSNSQRHKKQNISSLLKEEEDFKLMEKMINNSDDLLTDSPESLLEFFMGNNCEFDTTAEQCALSNSVNSVKQGVKKKNNLRSLSCSKDIVNKFPVTLNLSRSNNNNADENISIKSPMNSNEPKIYGDQVTNQVIENSMLNNLTSKESPNVEKTFNDTISYVLQKLNLYKDSNGILSHNSSGKSSIPNAYLVDSNGLTNALSIIQSLNPGAKVTTQQFYLVNSGPQLILQPNPPLAVVAENLSPSSSQINFQPKVSLAPKMTSPVSSANHISNVIRDYIPPNSNAFGGMSLNKPSYNPTISEKLIISNSSEPSVEWYQNSSLKVPVTETKNTFMVSSITQNLLGGNQPRSLHLQTISTPQPIGFVQQSLTSLFPSQLRFMQPSLTNSGTPNSISFLANNATCNASIVNTNQQPKLLFLCPTVSNNSNLVNPPNILNQDHKYLVLSKQPDKQTTIQLVSSQGLWQQLNPTIISQPSNVLVMQSQPMTTIYESVLCSNAYLPAVSPINSDYLINERNNPCSNDSTSISMPSVYKESQVNQTVSSVIECSSPLVIDSRPISLNIKVESSNEMTSDTKKRSCNEDSMTTATSLLNHVNSAFLYSSSVQPVTPVNNENKMSIDENHLNPSISNQFKHTPIIKSDQLETMLQSSQDVNLAVLGPIFK